MPASVISASKRSPSSRRSNGTQGHERTDLPISAMDLRLWTGRADRLAGEAKEKLGDAKDKVEDVIDKAKDSTQRK